MMRDRLHIRKQHYRDFQGERPLSYAVYNNFTFLCYAFSFGRAWQALQLIRETRQRHAAEAANPSHSHPQS